MSQNEINEAVPLKAASPPVNKAGSLNDVSWASKVRQPPGPNDKIYNAKLERLKADVMASPKVVHSNYVPAQVERHLNFLDFNKGRKMIKQENQIK